MSARRISIVVPSSLPPEQVPSLAQTAETQGLRRLWLTEDCFFAGGVAGAAAALAATDELEVGCGVFGAVGRHPAILAMEIAALCRLHPGRFIPGLGLGASVWLEQMDLLPARPLTAVREATRGLRSLLAGESVAWDGSELSFRDVALTHPPASCPPIYLGVLNPTALEAAGEIGDGVVLSVLAGPEYVRVARAHVAAGAARAGRPVPPITVYAIASISDDRAAREAVRAITAFYLMAGAGSLLTSCLGLDEMVASTLAASGVDGLASALDAATIDSLTVAGSPTTCAHRIAELLDAGADEVALYLYPTSTTIDQVEHGISEVLGAMAGRG